MSDYGLVVTVTENSNDGSPIAGAEVSGELVPVRTDGQGHAVVDTVLLTVTAKGYQPYVSQPYERPSLQAPVTVSLQRSA